MLASRKSESEGDPLIVMQLWLIVSGIYIWEFIITLDFEWSFIRRHQPYRWTIWLYSLSRLSGFAVIIIAMINFFNTSPINCQAWITFGWVFGALGGYGLSSLLIVLRIFAIWDKSKFIKIISGTMWVVNLGLQVVAVIKLRAESWPATRSCASNDERSKKYYFNLFQLITDFFLLFTMLVGLLCLRRGKGSFYLWHLLWKQGVIWLAIATSAQLPVVTFVFLNLNKSLSVLFVMPSNVIIIMAATRMYRSLIYSASPPDFHVAEPVSVLKFQRATRRILRTKDSSTVPISSNQLEVTVHAAIHEEYSMSQTNHHSSCPSLDARLTEKPHDAVTGSAPMNDVEGGEKLVVTSA